MELKKEKNRMYIEENEELLAEITFPDVMKGLVDINHTYVSDKLRGQGIASKLVQAVVDELLKENKTCLTSCSYAKAWFDNHHEVANILRKDTL